MKHIFLLVSIFTFSSAQLFTATPPTRPNILVILADDLGYGDPHCYNPERGRIPTPNIDRLAREGMRFTDAHASSAVCSPSRYTLLTGRYHWRTRLQSGIVGVWGRPLIAPDRLTIAGLAKQSGYRTGAIGKWHLGWDWPIKPDELRFFKGLGGKPGMAKEPIVTIPTDEQQTKWRETFAQPIAGGPTTRGFDTYFGTDVPNWPPYSFIRDNRTVGIPTDLLTAEQLLGFNASLQGPALKGWRLEEVLPTLSDRAVEFITTHATAASPFLLYLPLTSPHTPIAVSDDWKGRSGLNDYADFVMQTDAVIGRVLAALNESGAAKNTLVFFTSDNGYETAIGIKPLEGMRHFPSGPLRGYKRDVWEGGHREPFIVRWPDVVKPGTVCHELVHHADLMATIADILGARLPDNAGEDSFSLLPLLKGSKTPVRTQAISCGANGVQGVRDGPWKLVCTREPQLFNLDDDIGENKNLASANPQRVADMLALREGLIEAGRSTPGPPLKNDSPVKRIN